MTGSDDRTELGKHKMKKSELINCLMPSLHLYPEQQLDEGLDGENSIRPRFCRGRNQLSCESHHIKPAASGVDYIS